MMCTRCGNNPAWHEGRQCECHCHTLESEQAIKDFEAAQTFPEDHQD
jgi:hypothetical protein